MEERFRLNINTSEFLWKKTCHINSVLYDVLKEKNHLALRKAEKFILFIKEQLQKKLEILDNYLLHNPPNFFDMKTSLRKIRLMEIEINRYREEIKNIEHNRTKLFFSDGKFKEERRMIFSGTIYLN